MPVVTLASPAAPTMLAGHDHARAGGSPGPDPAAQPERNHVDDGRHGDGRPDRHLDDRSHRHLHRAAAAHRRHVPRRLAPGHGYSPGTSAPAHRERLMTRALLVALDRGARGRGAGGCVHAGRSARREPVVPRPGSRVRRLADAAAHARAGQGGDRRLGHRRHASRLRRPDRATRGASSAAARTSTTRGARHVRRRRDRGEARQRHRDRGHRVRAQLLVAKVVEPDGTISLPAEADAIRWAADNGAQVINLSLGGVRDPLHPKLDTYSPLEAAAVAVRRLEGRRRRRRRRQPDEAPRRRGTTRATRRRCRT